MGVCSKPCAQKPGASLCCWGEAHRFKVRGHVIAATKVVGGALYEVHRLSNGTACVELTGLGCYQCVGAGRRLLENLEQRTRDAGHSTVVLLAAPSAIQFYLRCEYRFLTEPAWKEPCCT